MEQKPKSIGKHEILKCVPTALQDLFSLITENTYEGIEKNGEDREQRKNAKTQVQKLLAGYLHCAEPAWAEITVGVEPGPGRGSIGIRLGARIEGRRIEWRGGWVCAGLVVFRHPRVVNGDGQEYEHPNDHD